MTKGVTVTRDKGKFIPIDYLAKVAETNKSGVGIAYVKENGVKVAVRRALGQFRSKDADEFQHHEGIKNLPVVLHYASANHTLTEEDLQPYTLLQNDDDSVALAVFLDGDFSAYEQEGSTQSAEARCVEVELLPRIMKVLNSVGADIGKIMEDLSDDITARTWANFMLGSRGSITLVACNGAIKTINVQGDTTQKQFDGWWTSNSLGYGESPKSLADSLATEAQGPPRPKLGLPGIKRPIASTTPVAPVTAPAPSQQPDVQPVPHPAEGTPTINPDEKIGINVPTGMETKRKFKWISKRMKGGVVPDINATRIVVARKDATPAFLQTYLEQNKLAGLGVATATAPAPAVDVGKAPIPKVQERPAISVKGKVGSYPAKAEAAPAPAPAPAPAQPPAEQPATPQVVTEPLPVFSPNQREELVNFINSPEIKAAIDANGQLIASPHGLEQMEKKVEGFSKQFGGLVQLSDITKWPLAEFMKYAKHDNNAVAKLAYCLAVELIKANKMLDELTAPVTREAEQPAQPAAPAVQPPRRMGIPARKTA